MFIKYERICDRTLPIVLKIRSPYKQKMTKAHYSSNDHLKGSMDLQFFQQLGLKLNTPKVCVFISSCVRKFLVFFFDLSFDRKIVCLLPLRLKSKLIQIN